MGFDSQNSLSAQDAQNLRNWGMNVVRLGVEWPGVEPAQGQFNETYLDVIEQIVDTLGEHGILSILDCHQGTRHGFDSLERHHPLQSRVTPCRH